MTSSTTPSLLPAALVLLALVATTNVVLAASLPLTPIISRYGTATGFWESFFTGRGNLQDTKKPLKAPDSLGSRDKDKTSNYSLGVPFHTLWFESRTSLYESTSSADDLDWVPFNRVDTKRQEPRTLQRHKRRALTKHSELYCEAERYPPVTIPVGSYVKIMSPGFPEAYDEESRCGWMITTEPESVIWVICPVFMLGPGDFTYLYDFAKPKDLRFNDSANFVNVTTGSDKLFFGFKSDSEGEGNCFLCLVRSLPNSLLFKTEGPVVEGTNPFKVGNPNAKERSRSTKVPTKRLGAPTENVTLGVSVVSDTKLPVTTSELPVTTSELPVTTSELPVTTSELPVTTSELPVTTSELPVTTSELPVTYGSPTEEVALEASVSDSKLPVTASPLPVTVQLTGTHRSPTENVTLEVSVVLDTRLPVTESELLVTEVHQPVTEVQPQDATIPSISSQHLVSSFNNESGSPAVLTKEYFEALLLQAEKGIKLNSIQYGQVTTNSEAQSLEKKAITPSSIWTNKQFAPVHQIKTYTVRRGESTYVRD